MRLFVSRVLPVLQHDAAFATPPAPARAPQEAAKPDVFAPAESFAPTLTPTLSGKGIREGAGARATRNQGLSALLGTG